MECSDALTSTSTIHPLNSRQESVDCMSPRAGEPSHSPLLHSSGLPSPTDSPPDSISSLPSIGSSFFFSSAAASPPQSHPHSDHARDTTQGLIIPSLSLPEALPPPTQYGKTLGDIRLIIIGDGAEDHDFVSSLLLDDNEDVVDRGTWEDTSDGSFLCASTDWIEHRDPHGLEKFEPARNVEIVTRWNVGVHVRVLELELKPHTDSSRAQLFYRSSILLSTHYSRLSTHAANLPSPSPLSSRLHPHLYILL